MWGVKPRSLPTDWLMMTFSSFSSHHAQPPMSRQLETILGFDSNIQISWVSNPLNSIWYILTLFWCFPSYLFWSNICIQEYFRCGKISGKMPYKSKLGLLSLGWHRAHSYFLNILESVKMCEYWNQLKFWQSFRSHFLHIGRFLDFNPIWVGVWRPNYGLTTLNVIWMQKVVPNLPFSYLGKENKKKTKIGNFSYFFFGESQQWKYPLTCKL